MKYDLIIIGGGPAGTAGAVYAARKQLKTLMIVAEWGGQSSVSENIENWIGTPSISGADLAKSFQSHAEKNLGEFLEIKNGFKATLVEKSGEDFVVEIENGEKFLTKTILATAGSSRRKLEVPGAAEFENKGITYCASCDGPLFAGQDVAVIGAGNAGFETVAQLLAYCKSVTMINRHDTFKADEITVKKVLANPKVNVIKNAEFVKITGDKFVNGIVYKEKASEEEKILPVTGIFVEIGQIPNTNMLKGLVELDEINRIKVDPKTQMTSLPGIWSAGDCTDGLYHQNNIAAGDAVKALENLYLYLHTK